MQILLPIALDFSPPLLEPAPLTGEGRVRVGKVITLYIREEAR
jgi:hypothetical protein